MYWLFRTIHHRRFAQWVSLQTQTVVREIFKQSRGGWRYYVQDGDIEYITLLYSKIQ